MPDPTKTHNYKPVAKGTAHTVAIRCPADIRVASGEVAGKPAAIISSVSSKQKLGLERGQVLLGRSVNGSDLSFFEMPIEAVQKDLKDLNQASKPYSLTVSYPMQQRSNATSPSRVPSTNHNAGRPVSHATPETNRRRVDSTESATSTSKAATPSRPRHNSAASTMSAAAATAAAAEYLSPGATSQIYQTELARAEQYASAGQDTASLAMGFGESGSDLDTIKASVARLRNQRIETENLRKQFRHKDTIIRKLSMENHDLHAKVQALQEMIDTQNSLLADLTVSEEKVKIMKAKEQTLMDDLKKEQYERESERKEHSSKIQELRREIATLQVQSGRDQMSLAEAKTDLVSVQKEMESLSLLHKQAEDRAKSIGKRMDSEYSGIFRERNELREYVMQLEETVQELRTEITCKSEELNMAESSSELARSTVVELERNLETLKEKLADQEASSSVQLTEVSRSLHDVTSRLNEEVAKREHLEEENEKLKRRTDEELESHKNTREVLMRRGNEHGELSAQVFRLTQSEQNLKAKNEVLTNKLEQSHKRLLEEMNKNVKYTQQIENERNATRAWARERSDLLSQFCVEERRFEQTTAALRDEVNRSNAFNNGAVLGSSATRANASWTVPPGGAHQSGSRLGAQSASATGVKHFHSYRSKVFSNTPVPFASFGSPRRDTATSKDSSSAGLE